MTPRQPTLSLPVGAALKARPFFRFHGSRMRHRLRTCARSKCRRPFVVQAGDFFVTCPDCRIYWQGDNRQELPHARERKAMHGESGIPLMHVATEEYG